MTHLVAVVGPTATGKTAVAVEIALAFGGEVVNADSRLFCRGFDIGTAKPTAAERCGVPHHLIDILGPGESLGLRGFLDRASAVIAEITARGRLPVLAGGTGQYVWGLLEGWQVSRVPPDPELRSRLEEQAFTSGYESVAAMLREVDPEAAARIDPRNTRRVIRALELAKGVGARAGGARRAEHPPYEAQVIGLTAPREEIYRRVDQRIDRMVSAGWALEVRRLLDSGVTADAPCMGGIGYRAMLEHVVGDATLKEAAARARRDTRRLVRRQYNWFKLEDPRIEWIQAGNDAAAEAVAAVRRRARAV